ncbi:C40 family peptidase [Streptomyces longispororuber]|uniref:C40 family peptidase n=1 Tax=Streptomyces longispororuber TaxID=68230 RepID=UPI00210EA441|nr:bifunctional lytic transglycosylase/C40 family peptidase [Streptomyces longispororuber]MCQ4214583.1 NlpC/P60 family protein [Streptomyces longispororuber]
MTGMSRDTRVRPARRWLKWALLTGVLLAVTVCCMAPLSGASARLAALSQQENADVGLAEAGSSADIPPRMLQAYKNAVQHISTVVPPCRGMRWPILAGIAKVESHHAAGRTLAANGDIRPKIYGVLLNGSGAGGNTSVFADTDGGKWDGTAAGERAVGPFQFMPATWESSGQDGNNDGARDPHNADDAALGAAAYLCGRGRNLARTDQLRAAIFQYNHSSEYVANVRRWIDQYTAAAQDLKSLSAKVRAVLDAASSQRGVPYSWGGGHADGKSTGICCSPSGVSGEGINGFDCSGLTTYAFAQVGIRLPRTAAAQAGRGQRIPATAGHGALRPGDLVFFGYAPGRDTTIYHVGLYVGGGRMINAARPGTLVRYDPVDAMPGYAGGARLL